MVDKKSLAVQLRIWYGDIEIEDVRLLEKEEEKFHT